MQPSFATLSFREHRFLCHDLSIQASRPRTGSVPCILTGPSRRRHGSGASSFPARQSGHWWHGVKAAAERKVQLDAVDDPCIAQLNDAFFHGELFRL